MKDQARDTRDGRPDAGEVVEGPIGGARLRNPASGPIGADLDALPPIDVGPGALGDGGRPDGRPIDGSAPAERQDRDHVGVDWDLTQRDRS
jgi:hypothetical protein